MKNSELKDYMNDNRDAIAKASRLGVGLIIGAVIIIGVVFYGIAPKTKKKPDTSSSQVQQATDAEVTAAEDEAANTTPTLEEMQKEDVPTGYLYRVTSDTPVLDKDGNYIGGAGEGELFSSYDPLALEDYGTDKKISIDYAVMEKSDEVYTIGASWDWSDLGSFAAIEAVTGKTIPQEIKDAQEAYQAAKKAGKQIILK